MSSRKGRFFFLGAIFGLLAGLFFAPKKGSELRQDAKDKIEEIKDNPKDVLHETINGVKEKVSSIVEDNRDEDNRDEDNIKISEDEIIISKTFGDEGEIR